MAPADGENLVDAPRPGLPSAAPGRHDIADLVFLDRGHPFEQPPHRRLGDLEIAVAGVAVPAAGRHQHAGDQAGDDEIRQELAFDRGQGAHRVVSPDDVRGVGQRVVAVEHEVGACDGELGDHRGVQHVAEIDDAAESRRAVVIGPHQQVAVVGVVVDHPELEFVEARRDHPVETLDPAFEELPSRGIGDELGITPQRRHGRQVPFQLSPGAGVVEISEREVEAGEGRADLLEQPRRAAVVGDEGDAFEIGDQPDPAGISIVVLRRQEIEPVGGRNRPLDQRRHRGWPGGVSASRSDTRGTPARRPGARP